MLCTHKTTSLPVWIISSQVHHRISTNSQPFLVGIVSAENMLTTSSNASATITKKSTSTGPANASVASTSTGIISIAHAISVCPATSTTPSTSFNIPHPKNHRTAPIQQLSNSMGLKSNSLTPLTLPPAYLHTRSNGSNRSLALSSFTVVLSTQPF